MSEQNLETVSSTPEGEPAPRWHSVHREPYSGPHLWAWARQAFLALPRGLHVVMSVIFIILGFALVMQVRAQRSDSLKGLSEQDLVTVLDELGTQEQDLRTRRDELFSELDDLCSAADEAQAQEQAARKVETQAQTAAGTVPVHGPGVVVSVADADTSLTSTQFVMTLGGLRNVGVEAIELNGTRLSTRSSFTGQAGSVVVGGTPILSSYMWKVIGEPQTIATTLDIQASSAAQMRIKDANVAITPSTDITIESIVAPHPPQFAIYQRGPTVQPVGQSPCPCLSDGERLRLIQFPK